MGMIKIVVYIKEASNDICNYKPITIIGNFVQVFEILLHEYLSFDVNRQISIHHHGFIEGRSIKTNLTTITLYTSFSDHFQTD